MEQESKQFHDILYEKKDFVAKITINRPQYANSLTIPTIKELCSALEEAEEDNSVGVVVLTGADKRVFCPGLDFNMFKKYFSNTEHMWHLLSWFDRIIYNIRHIGKPVIVRVNGVGAGGGAEMILACDLAIAADHAGFQVGEAGVGLPPIYATQILPLSIGEKRARELLFTDRVIEAKVALDWGLYNEIVPYEKLDDCVDKWCKTVLNKFPLALRFTKTQANIWFDLLTHSFYEGRDYCALQYTTREPWEGLEAFLQKRPAEPIKLRQEAAAGKPIAYWWGPPTKTCPKCKTSHLPDYFEFCGKCGTKLV